MPKLFVAIGAAAGGIVAGMAFLEKVTMQLMEILILVLLYLFGILLAFGVI